MNYRRLGRTNLNVSVVGFGTCQLRLVPEKQAIQTLIRGFQMGVNIIHTSPEYEGAERLIGKALRESDVKEKVYICSQAWGDMDYFERLFESTCETLGTHRLDLFGINSLYDLEMFGENVWGKGGMVDFLQCKKEEGRLGAIFCTTHGPVHHLKDRIQRDVFDAVMVSYNILGFHTLSYNPCTLFALLQQPQDQQEKRGFEDIPRLKGEIFPLLKERDIGLMVMKPLSGGLLCPGTALVREKKRAARKPFVGVRDILRYTLMNPYISCVLPGTASVEEATENAEAGREEIDLDAERIAEVESYAAELSRSLCSRCGACDGSCSKGLPISWLFRAIYLHLSLYATFEGDDRLQYFALHPNRESACLHCEDVTCRCPNGIDIRENLILLHAKMVDFSRRGRIRSVSLPPSSFSGRRYDSRVIMKEIPETLRANEKSLVRICFQNTGQLTWYAFEGKGHSFVCLAVYVDGHLTGTVRLRSDVPPEKKVHFVFDLIMPEKEGDHLLKLDLFEHEVTFFSEQGVPPVEASIKVVEPGPTQSEDEAFPGYPEEPVQRRPDYSVRYLDHNIPPRISGGSARTFRIKVQNTGTKTWYRDPPDGHFVGLAAFIEKEFKTTGRSMLDKVEPGQVTVIGVTFQVPEKSGRYRLKFDMVAHNISMFENLGMLPLCVDIEVVPREKTLSEELWDKAKDVNYWFFSPGLGVHLSQDRPAYPLFAKSAKGSHITDVEGRQYIDLVMGWGCALLGYADRRIQKAVASELSSSGIMTLTHPLEIEVSEMLCDMIPSAEMVLYGKNGSDVCTAAVRMARALTQRKKILVCGYHGWQDWYAEQYGFRRTGVPENTERWISGFPYGEVEALRHLLHHHNGEVAAVMMDPSSPVTNLNGPIPEVDSEYLKDVASLTREAGAVLIFDEILSGFRYREGSVQKAHGVTPDLTCLGKALSAGMPLSALAGKRDIFDQTLPRIYYSPTFKGEAYSFAAAKEALKIYRSEDIPSYIWRFGSRLKQCINEICDELGLPAEVIGPPFRLLLAFGETDCERSVMMRTLLVQELTKNGVITWKGLMLPSCAHDNRDLEKILEAFRKAASVIYRAWKEDSFVRYLEIPDDP